MAILPYIQVSLDRIDRLSGRFYIKTEHILARRPVQGGLAPMVPSHVNAVTQASDSGAMPLV